MSTFNDCRISLHRLCQMQGKVSTSAARTSASSFLFAVKFSFYTDMINHIELPSFVPRQFVGDCFEIHTPD